jgi:N-acyl homoserine lactone hydrolase
LKITITPVLVADLLAEGQRLIRALEPDIVWLAHTHEPWRPSV